MGDFSFTDGGYYTPSGRNLGEVSTFHPITYKRALFAEGAGIFFGGAVVKGSASGKCALPSAATDEFIGVASLSMDASDGDNSEYLDGDPVTLQDAGYVMVYSEEAVDENSPVRVRLVDGATPAVQKAGGFCTTADTGKTATITNARFNGKITAAGPVEIYLNGPFATVQD